MICIKKNIEESNYSKKEENIKSKPEEYDDIYMIDFDKNFNINFKFICKKCKKSFLKREKARNPISFS